MNSELTLLENRGSFSALPKVKFSFLFALNDHIRSAYYDGNNIIPSKDRYENFFDGSGSTVAEAQKLWNKHTLKSHKKYFQTFKTFDDDIFNVLGNLCVIVESVECAYLRVPTDLYITSGFKASNENSLISYDKKYVYLDACYPGFNLESENAIYDARNFFISSGAGSASHFTDWVTSAVPEYYTKYGEAPKGKKLASIDPEYIF